ncbi:forkhead box protein H1-like [Ambystoma mexicanum]|uniref:forkhead box protein H1-like n=1 Tax=Ambystoma mexicanum TaxID=8296 RepID=UPI0037E79A62
MFEGFHPGHFLHPRAERPPSCVMDKGVDLVPIESPGSEREDAHERGGSGAEEHECPGEGAKKAKVKRKKNYHRYAKPPYSYLAMIALVIQNSPEKKLKLSQILKEISTLFPLFKGDYQGWKDSIRHNLSSNNCFQKVLKDPGKPQSKGNFWSVDVSRIPLEALKLQNTAIARQGGMVLADDLSPYILHGWKYNCEETAGQPEAPPVLPTCTSDKVHQPSNVSKINNSFMIDSLLHDMEDMSLPGKSPTAENGIEATESHQYVPTGNGLTTHNHVWIPAQYLYTSSRPPSVSWRPSYGLGYTYSTPVDPRTFSSSSSLSTISSISSISDDEKDAHNRRQQMHPRKRPNKRPRVDNRVHGSSRSDSDDTDDQDPAESPKSAPLMPWELPTSYTKCVPPNAVAPPSAHHFFPFSSLPSLPQYTYKPPIYSSPAYWGVMPSHSSPVPHCHRPPGPVDLDSMLQAVPPNKSVFDVWSSHPGDVLLYPPFFTMPPFPSGTDLIGPRPL